VVLTVYFLLPGIRARNGWLLLVSLLFYAWGEVGFILLLLVSTLANFELGKWVQRSEEISRRKIAVAVAVVVNVGFLAWFKYAGLVVASLNVPLGYWAWACCRCRIWRSHRHFLLHVSRPFVRH